MIHVDKYTTIPSVEQTLGILRTNNQMMPLFFDFDKICSYIGLLNMNLLEIKEPLYEILQYSDSYSTAIDYAMQKWISNQGIGLLFNSTKTGISLSKDSFDTARETGKLSQDQLLVMKSYQDFMNCRKTVRTLMGLLQYPVLNRLSYDNHRMIYCRPTWTAQNTGRVAMSDPAVQNFPRGVQDIQTVPKGWILKHVDSGQIEPRITYSAIVKDPQIKALINLYNDAYFGILHYINLPDEVINSGTTNFQKNEITDQMKENRQRIKTYGNAVMYGSTSNPSGDPIKAKMIERIGKHKLRLQYVAQIEDKLNHGVRQFPTAFGTLINISASAKLNPMSTFEEQKHELVKLAINNPIQGTAADLMRVSVMEAYKICSLKSQNSYILDYVHDAGVFAIHEDDYDLINDELSDVVSYDVDGWIPIYAEGEEGRGKGLYEDLY